MLGWVQRLVSLLGLAMIGAVILPLQGADRSVDDDAIMLAGDRAALRRHADYQARMTARRLLDDRVRPAKED